MNQVIETINRIHRSKHSLIPESMRRDWEIYARQQLSVDLRPLFDRLRRLPCDRLAELSEGHCGSCGATLSDVASISEDLSRCEHCGCVNLRTARRTAA